MAGFALSAGALLLLGAGLAMYLGGATGDLTRIGRMASLDWRPHHAQKPLERVSNTFDGHADIQILGDSFSAENLWQSELQHMTGLRTRTWRYNDIGCIDAWLLQAIQDTGPHNSPIIILETIEREFTDRFSAASSKCGRGRNAPMTAPASIVPGTIEAPVFPIDLRYILAAAHHHFWLSERSGKIESHDAITVDLVHSRLFSNRLPKRLSYFSGDDEKRKNWSPERQKAALDYVHDMQKLASTKGKKLLLVVIPDKSTTYSPWIAQRPVRHETGADSLFTALSAGLGSDSNYLPAFQAGALRIMDLYRPDDTHLSLDGYRLLAAEISQRAGWHCRTCPRPATTSSH